MEQKAKRVGKFNIIDIIAVILIVAVVAFGAWKLLGSSGGTAAEDGGMVKVTYVVKCEGVPAELYETCQAHLPSPLMASGALVGGQIESVEMEPYYVLGPDGQWIEDPEHVTLLFTATTETPAGEVMTTKVGDQEVRIGKTDYILKSEYIEFSGGTIVDVRWNEAGACFSVESIARLRLWAVHLHKGLISTPSRRPGSAGWRAFHRSMPAECCWRKRNTVFRAVSRRRDILLCAA